MSNKDKSICIIEFLGKKIDWDSWSEKFLLHGKQKGYDKIGKYHYHTWCGQNFYAGRIWECTWGRKISRQNKNIKLSELNELANKYLILSINTSFSFGKVVFVLEKKSKSEDFPKGNCKVARDRLVSKYALHTASSLLKLKSEFHNSK